MKPDAFRNQVILALVLVVAGLIAWRLFILSYVRHTVYSKTAQAQNENIANVLIRGNIYLQDPKAAGSSDTANYTVATDKKFPLVYAVPELVADPAAAAHQLHTILNIDEQSVLATLATKTPTTKIIASKISTDAVKEIGDLNMKGIGIRYEMDRYYPAGILAANVLGFFGFDDQGRSGQYGVEAYFDNELSGAADTSSRSLPAVKPANLLDSLKNFFSSGSVREASAPRPADIILTIDRNIQSFAEAKLDEVLKKWSASGGTIIVQDPQTGKILAMADRPSFDPNSYSISSAGSYLNRSVEEVFEPGSSFKPITMAAGLDTGKVTPDTTYTDPGTINIAGYQIHNFDQQAHGTVSMTTVLEKSLNTGAAFVENLLGQDTFLNYVINFGLGQKTGIDLPGEVNGDVSNLYSGRQINFVTASFGQGIAVTPLQLINAYSAIANGGKLMKPYVVDHISYEDGHSDTTQPEVVSIPITPKTSQKLRSMLVSVVDHGFDKARITGYDVAGKTGTAQIPSSGGGYEEGTFIHDFLGFAPASDPKFVVLIKMDRPKGITFAADSLSPVFRDVAQYIINYYNIPPTR